MAIKNNVTRFLDSKKIHYTAHELPNERVGALEAAEYLGMEPERVYKTIVVLRQRQGKPILAMASATQEVDLKALAKSVGEKKVKPASYIEAEKITGLQTGGISPLALINQGFEVYIDEKAKNYAYIFISGGQRGLNIQISPIDLGKLTRAKFKIICKEV